jgi:hypothetical protein
VCFASSPHFFSLYASGSGAVFYSPLLLSLTSPPLLLFDLSVVAAAQHCCFFPSNSLLRAPRRRRCSLARPSSVVVFSSPHRANGLCLWPPFAPCVCLCAEPNVVVISPVARSVHSLALSLRFIFGSGRAAAARDFGSFALFSSLVVNSLTRRRRRRRHGESLWSSSSRGKASSSVRLALSAMEAAAGSRRASFYVLARTGGGSGGLAHGQAGPELVARGAAPRAPLPVRLWPAPPQPSQPPPWPLEAREARSTQSRSRRARHWLIDWIPSIKE